MVHLDVQKDELLSGRKLKALIKQLNDSIEDSKEQNPEPLEEKKDLDVCTNITVNKSDCSKAKKALEEAKALQRDGFGSPITTLFSEVSDFMSLFEVYIDTPITCGTDQIVPCRLEPSDLLLSVIATCNAIKDKSAVFNQSTVFNHKNSPVLDDCGDSDNTGEGVACKSHSDKRKK